MTGPDWTQKRINCNGAASAPGSPADAVRAERAHCAQRQRARESKPMNGAEVIAEILKREGTEFLACYPRNPLIEACAAIDIRPILCRQERVGVGMADGFTPDQARQAATACSPPRPAPASRMPSPASRRPIPRMCRCWSSRPDCRSSGNTSGRCSAPPTFIGR